MVCERAAGRGGSRQAAAAAAAAPGRSRRRGPASHPSTPNPQAFAPAAHAAGTYKQQRAEADALLAAVRARGAVPEVKVAPAVRAGERGGWGW